MRKLKFIILVFLFCKQSFSGMAQNFGGNPASVKWKQVNTGKVRVIFPNGLDSQANRIANVMRLLGDTTSKNHWWQAKKMEYHFAEPNDHTQCLCAHGACNERIVYDPGTRTIFQQRKHTMG